jgi:alpha-glucosidase
MPVDVRHDNEGQPSDHREVHNVYGLLNSRATFEGLERLRPDQRPFVLTRATFAGGQRWAAVWPGDNTADWTQLRATIPMFANMGLSGLSFVGSDIGGFAKTPSAELFTRWLQLGVFYPFMRAHTEIGSPDQEPWSYGVAHEAINRRAIELRYELLPHIYNVMRESSESGLPAFRPLLLEYPEDPRTYNLNQQFLFGRDLLVAPVLREAVREQELYLPAGEWYDFSTGRAWSGGRSISVPVTLDSIPVFVRAGAFVFRQPVVQHTGEMAGQALRVHVYPAAQSEARLYEDDGETLAYRRGVALSRRFEQRRSGTSCSISVGAPEGAYRPAARSLELWVRFDGQPRSVSVGSEVLPRVAAEQLAAQARGWTSTEGGFVVVKLPDRWEAFRVALD